MSTEQKPPKKWFPESLSIIIRCIVLPFVLLDLGAQKIARFIIPPPFKKGGSCKQRGKCCVNILVRRSKGIFGWLDLFWHTQINGFYKRQKQPVMMKGKKFHLMGCRYLAKDGRCKRYHLRPIICRTWPRIEIFGRPEILKGCGYEVFLRKDKKKNPFPIFDQDFS